MSIKKPVLGKGLEALLGGATREAGVLALEANLEHRFVELELAKLSPGRYQPRRKISEAELESLADSIRVQGVIQPIVARKLGDNKYEIIAGERRWRASQMAGLKNIPTVLLDVSHDKAMAIALIENIQRENLSALEEAQAVDRLIREFDLTHVQVAEAIGKSRVSVTNLLRLLTLPEDVKALLERGEIEAGHAKVLLALRGHEQSQMAAVVASRKLSVRETERLVAESMEEHSSKSESRSVKSLDPDIRRLQDSLSEKLGAMVVLTHGQTGKGKILIHYNSLDELEGILEYINKGRGN